MPMELPNPLCIAVIVSLDNPVDGLTTEQVRDIYMGEITEWSEIDE